MLMVNLRKLELPQTAVSHIVIPLIRMPLGVIQLRRGEVEIVLGARGGISMLKHQSQIDVQLNFQIVACSEQTKVVKI